MILLLVLKITTNFATNIKIIKTVCMPLETSEVLYSSFSEALYSQAFKFFLLLV